jgi:hypothetical protein
VAAPKIKKRKTSAKTSPIPRQGAVPCLIIIALVLLIVGVLLYFSLRSAT